MNSKFGRLRLRLVPAFAGLLAAASFAGAPLDTVRDCATSASPTLHGLKELSAACPELQPALGNLGLDQILYQGWREKLSRLALQDAIDLSERYSNPRWHGAPDTSAVPGILQALRDEQAPQAISWWRSFKNWIKQWLEHSDSSFAKWIKHLFENILDNTNVPPAFLRAFVYVVTILTGLAAIVVIVRELRAAGIGARFRRVRSALPSAQNSSALPPAGEAESTDENTPAGLLRALVKRLLQTGRLATERSLTHRELIARASFESDAHKTVFANLARTAESVLYGARPATPESLQTVTRQGRELLRQLAGLPSP